MGNSGPGQTPEGELVTRVLAMPADANPAGDIFGGWVISHVDMSGAIVAVQVAKGRVATVAITSAQFLAPILIGDLVSFYVKITRIGRTSITVKVDAHTQRRENEIIKAAEATIVYVAVDENRRPVVVGERI